MALQRQNIPLPLAQGADTRTDSYILPPGKLTVLKNGTLTVNGTVQKRNGMVSLGQATNTGGTIGDGQGMAAYRDELVVMDKTALYSYANSLSSFLNKGSYVSAAVTQDQTVRTNGTQGLQESAINATTGLQVITYRDVTNGTTTLRYSMVDTNTGQVVVKNQVLASNTTGTSKAIAAGNYLVVFYANAVDFKLYMIKFVGITPGTATVVTATMDHVYAAYDACILPGVNGSTEYLAVVWNNDDVAGGVSIQGYSATTLVAYGGVLALVSGQAANSAITVFPDQILDSSGVATSQRLVVAYSDGTNVRIVSCTSTFTAGGGIADQLIEALGAGTCEAVTGVSYYATGAYAGRVYFTNKAVGNPRWKDTVRYASIAGNVVTASGVWFRSVSLATKAFMYNSLPWVGVAYDPTDTSYNGLQPTYFVLTDGPVVAARLLYGQGGGFRGNSILPEVTETSTGQFSTVLLQKDLLTTVPNSPNLGAPTAVGSVPNYVYTTTGVTTVTLNFFEQQTSYFSATCADVLHLSGGCLHMYDGTQVVEHGFHLAPEGVTVSMAGGAGFLSAGTYTYYVCYEWTDAQGRLHRSAPSPGVQVTAAALNTATITVPTLRITGKAAVNIVAYRTAVNNQVPYRLGTPASPTVNSTTADTVTITDTAADTSITSAPPLYVLGSVAENIPLGPCTGLATYKDRLLAIASDSPNNIWYSKPTQNAAGVPVEFNDGFYISVDPIGGPVSAIAVMDDKIVIFKENRILVSGGDGPDSTGQGGAFSPPQVVSTDTGCIEPRSIVLTPNGLMFRGHKGIYLLNRGLQVIYIGQEVEDKLENNAVVSGTVAPSIQQVRMGLDDGQTVLVYDYLASQWSWFENPELSSVAACIHNNLYTYLQPSGVVGQEDTTVWTDFGNFIQLEVVTGWINVGDLNGFVRLYGVELLGRYFSDHLLEFSVAYDNADSWVKTGSLASTSLFDPGLWGGSGTWGSTPPTYWGGPDSTMVARFDPAKQKCRTFRLRIRDLAFNNDFGQSCSLTGLTLSVGIKGGLGRLPAANQVGVS